MSTWRILIGVWISAVGQHETMRRRLHLSALPLHADYSSGKADIVSWMAAT